MIEKKFKSPGHFGIFADCKIAPHQIVFTREDWYEDTKEGWEVLTWEEVERLPQDQREFFLRYSFDTSFGKTLGTFSEDHVRNPTNFLNHSCEPTLYFDGSDQLRAHRTIGVGEELTLDYGTFVVNVDQEFLCHCGSSQCRGKISKEDWKLLAARGESRFPSFLKNFLKESLPSNAKEFSDYVSYVF